jgi:hypothetical protein
MLMLHLLATLHLADDLAVSIAVTGKLKAYQGVSAQGIVSQV